MKLETLLKNGRESAHLTQEEAANRLDVNSNTISNWERGTVIPASRDWGTIAEVYGIERQDFLNAANEKIWPKDDGIPAEFPSCMFSEKGLKKVKKLVFTPQETELMRLLSIYNTNWKISSSNEYRINEILGKLPNEYFNRVGISRVEELGISVCKKLQNDEIQNVVLDWLTAPDDGIFLESFNVFKAPFDCIYYLARDGMKNDFGDTNIFSNVLLDVIDNIKNGYTIVFDENDINLNNSENKQLMKFKSLIQQINDNPMLLLQDVTISQRIIKYIENPSFVLDEVKNCFKYGWNNAIAFHTHLTCTQTCTLDECSSFLRGSVIDQDNDQSPFEDWVVFDYFGEIGHRVCKASLTEKGEELYSLFQKIRANEENNEKGNDNISDE